MDFCRDLEPTKAGTGFHNSLHSPTTEDEELIGIENASNQRPTRKTSHFFCAGANTRDTLLLGGLIFPAGNIVPVLLKEDIFVLPSGGGRDIITIFLQPIEDFFGGLLIRLSAFRVKVGQYLVQTINTDPCIVREPQHAPTNCWLFRFSSCHSSFHFKL